MKFKYLSVLLLIISTLFVKAQNSSTWSSSGIVLSSGGYIATCNHTLPPGYHYEVDVYNGEIKTTYLGVLVKADPTNDLAIIRVDNPYFITIGTVPFSFKMMGIKKDEKVFALGYPQLENKTSSLKLVEGLMRSKSGYPNDINLYKVSCALRPGQSGSPLFDNFGNLIGIMNSGDNLGLNEGYAVKISCLNNLLDVIPTPPSMPLKTTISALSLTDKVDALTKFIVSIRESDKVIVDTAKAKKMFVGQTYGGGIIFYVDDSGEHGLIASVDDGDSQRTEWGCYNAPVEDTEVGVGTGQENTKKIIVSCRTGNAKIAARLCNEFVSEGFSDWFLPSKEELNLLYEQKEIIGGYEHGYYWSSSEFDQHFAWYQHFDFGFQDYLNKDFLYFYRPIRAF